MIVHQYYTESQLRNFTYLLEDEDKKFWCVDPFDALQVKKWLKELGAQELVGIINTHEHWDHIRGNESLVQDFGAKIYAHENAKGKIPGVKVFLKDGDKIELSSGEFLEVMDTPGHTMAHLCFLHVKDEIPVCVFTGDTLFNAGVGNCHNGGDPEVLFETISKRFHILDEDIIVYPGHDYLSNNLRFTLDREPNNNDAKEWLEKSEQANKENRFLTTNIADEKRINTFFRLTEKEIIENIDGDTSTEKQIFLRLRELRNKW
ncbi:MAG: MBL fold metallo-hydrolase [Oligoflexia bacterium]|nr:MBL fold metallo-hydrolase [Oligoflexia bacterium]